ncbi:MAG: hypothetical protein DWH81_15760 [Planctomycetota bacterium]|nr:MAG: hypothetical protein DWH81_15760 [Planctomycetota bacterium]
MAKGVLMARHGMLLLVAAAILICAGIGLVSPNVPVRADSLAATGDLRWYRGNMHTHSHWSDGDDYLESIAAWYQKEGYQFLVFTDHNVLADRDHWVEIKKTKGKEAAFEKLKQQFPDWVDERMVDGRHEVRLRRYTEVAERFNKPGEYLLIQGEEISDKFQKYPIHMNVSNIKEVLTPRGGDSVAEVLQNNVDAAVAQRERTGQPMIIHLNHPNFGYAVRAEDLMRIIGERFFEVYNGHPGVNNSGDPQHAGAEAIWDIVLTKRLAELKLPVMFGIAVDDGHEYHNIPSRASEPGRGWVMVLAKELSATALIESLEAGRFYASSGVKLSRVDSSDEGLAVEVEAVPGEEYTIEFIGTRKGYNTQSEPVLDAKGEEIHTTRRYSADIGVVLATVKGPKAQYKMQGDEVYVRARVTSTAKHPNPSEVDEFQRAWVQPVVGPAGR